MLRIFFKYTWIQKQTQSHPYLPNPHPNTHTQCHTHIHTVPHIQMDAQWHEHTYSAIHFSVIVTPIMSTFSDTSPHQSYPSPQWTQGVYPPPHTSLTPAIKGPRGYTHHHTPVLPQPSKDPGSQLHPPPHTSLTPAIKGPRRSVAPTTTHQSYPSHQGKDHGGQLHPSPHTSLTPAIKGPKGSLTPTTLCQSYPSHQRTQVSYTHHPTPVLPQPSKNPGGQLHPPPHTSLTPAIKGPRKSVTPTTPRQSYPSHQAKDPGGHLWTAAVSVGRGSVCSWHPWCGCCATPASCSSWSPSLCWVAATWWYACCGPRSTHGPAHPHVAPSCNTQHCTVPSVLTPAAWHHCRLPTVLPDTEVDYPRRSLTPQ